MGNALSTKKLKLLGFSHLNSDTQDSIAYTRNSGFLGVLHVSYMQHIKLRISPSDFIILIGKGLSLHVRKTSEKFKRYLLEKIEDKKEKIVV